MKWSGRTVVCIASGPSLTPEDCELVQQTGHPTIVTNTTFRSCLWAHALFAFDLRWWRKYHEEVRDTFHGRRLSASEVAANYGAEVVYGRYRALRNSGACAVEWAIQQGAAKIVLLAFDAMLGENGETHHHGGHPKGLRNAESIEDWPRQFATLAKYGRGIEIVNASRKTSLKCFPRNSLESCL